ncbi:hypothetical protein LAZ40_22245 [Cereibacter sphaeroides]|uniref:hypothetical protein n=1 Tax=Cereibacter sphaeroides TaxID=1063 RepID=UPI001F25190C|nr:hypothetical protein [Cereibacter sphaeroides]MCE6961759.1 hypothetical protein [Cereibacter sphaeroides]MCE6970534.1 hypothetical protein [Cereibacter sphaeroides]MCE6971888.1 hypothetical protein [Cereibacter sphaeroides]
MSPVSISSGLHQAGQESSAPCHRLAAIPNAAGILLHGPWLRPAASFLKEIPGIEAIGLATPAILVPKASAPQLQAVLSGIDAWRSREAARLERTLWLAGLIACVERYNAKAAPGAMVEIDLPILAVPAPTAGLRAILLRCGFAEGDGGALWIDLSSGAAGSTDEFRRAQAIADGLDEALQGTSAVAGAA